MRLFRKYKWKKLHAKDGSAHCQNPLDLALFYIRLFSHMATLGDFI